jgi:hypothetical protein
VKRIALIVITLIAGCIFGLERIRAQELVATVETLSGIVSVQRFDTAEFVPIDRESLVGVGDIIRTDSEGRARVTFFANGVDTELEPNTDYRIDEFSGSEQEYNLSVTVLVGQTTQRVNELLDSGSSYRINSTGLELAVRGTVFAVRVEETGRSATIVEQGLVRAESTGGDQAADVPPGFGVRADTDTGLSDVVEAVSFAQLDSALDGCGAVIVTEGDVRLNVRLGPGLQFPILGLFQPNTRQTVVGVTETTEWYRVPFAGAYAWVFAPAVELDASCAGLRQFPDDTPPEDPANYTGLENMDLTPNATIDPTSNPTSNPTSSPTPSPTPAS